MAEEKSFENKVKNFLSYKGYWYIKYWAGADFTRDGIPDILACIDGKFYGIEIKAKNGRPTLLQLINLRKIREAGGIGILLYPDDYKYFMELIGGTEIGYYWYRDNRTKQREWFEKLSH